jgi:chitodextrinase
VLALLFSVKPGLSPTQTESLLESTAVDLGTSGRDDLYGYGRVDAGAAVVAALGNTPTPADTIAPTAPSNLTVTPTDMKVTLSWTGSTDNVGVTQYLIYRDGIQTGTSTTASYTDTAVNSQTTYTYAVKATDAAGNVSTSSNVVTTTTLVTPLAITSITAKVTGATTTSVTWTTSSPVASSVLEYGTSPTSLGLSATVSDTTTTHTANLSGLAKKTRYYYRVTVTGLKGEIVTSSIQNFTTRPK